MSGVGGEKTQQVSYGAFPFFGQAVVLGVPIFQHNEIHVFEAAEGIACIAIVAAVIEKVVDIFLVVQPGGYAEHHANAGLAYRVLTNRFQ